jgi:hypothetical protein
LCCEANVDNLICTAQIKYRHAWIVAETGHVQEAARELGTSVEDFAEHLETKLKTLSKNVSKVSRIQEECNGISYHCFHVQQEPGRSQFTHNIMARALDDVGLVAENIGQLPPRTEDLILKNQKKRKRGNDTGEWAAVAAQLGIEDESSTAVLAAIKDLQQHAAAQSQRATILGKGYYSLLYKSADRLGAAFSLMDLVSGSSWV